MFQRCYKGVRLLNMAGPSMLNIRKLDMGAMPMIMRMQHTGLQVDLAHFERLSKELTADMDRITEEVHTATGYYINIDSGDQVADLLFKKMGIKQARPKLTKSGDRESVEDEILKAIQHEHPVVGKVQDFKELSKLRGTYVKPIPKLAVHVGFGIWRMFPNFKTTRVPSGRLACSEPNLLAMPTRTERGRDIRRGFITRDGWCYLSVDESQIEVRLAAHMSQDESLIKVYYNEEDIYSDFAIAAFRLQDKRFKDDKGKWQYPGVHKMDHRYPAKTCVLASLYDVSASGLLDQMPVVCGNCGKLATEHTCGNFVSLWTEQKCQELITAFYLRYPGVMKDRKRAHAIARRLGYIYCMWGRLLHVAAVKSIHEWVVAAALREVGNFPYQSGAQGTVKLTMAQVDDEFLDWKTYEVCSPLLQVHDELVLECKESEVKEIGAHIAYRFENCCRLNVPIKASMATAPTWGDLEK